MMYDTLSRGEDRYIDFNDKFLHLEFARVQDEILRAAANHRRLLIISGNGVGKSFIVAFLKLAFSYSNPDSVVLGTSGSYGQYIDTMWRPLESMYRDLKTIGLPGNIKGGNSPSLEIEKDWYINVASPKHPDELEGRHGSKVLVVIEEADKPYITENHFESAGSSVTDSGDRIVAIANPPRDESNVVYDKMKSNRWHTIQFSSFDSHNVRYDMGKEDNYIDGLVDLPTLADDWEAWHQEEWPEARHVWDGQYPGMAELIDGVERGEIERERVVEALRPGFEKIRVAHESRNDLSEAWYRRRVGVTPPDTAEHFRPFTLEHVRQAVGNVERPNEKPLGVGYDVARQGGDWNVIACRYDNVLWVHDRWQGVDHNVNYRMITADLRRWRDPPFAIDAQGEGSGTADRISERHPTRRFKSGEKAVEKTKFKFKWDESLWYLGQFMKNGGQIGGHDKIEEELSAAAREIQITEKWYDSRSAEVMEMTSKDKVKERLGRSPDILDALLMANWIGTKERGSERLTW